jgi:hypothetical protein
VPRTLRTLLMRDRCQLEREWEHGLERNCPVRTRRKNTLMIFVGVSPSGNLGQATISCCSLIVA